LPLPLFCLKLLNIHFQLQTDKIISVKVPQ
jgi:hypothetical protein